MKALWTLEACPTCEGSGFDYCEKCERRCEHDRLCPTCHGNEQVPVKLEGFALIAHSLVGCGTVYRTKREALTEAAR
jgi:DnaJ-class molecular chaperone